MVWRLSENPDVYKVLVSDLSHTIAPTSIMGLTLASVSFYAWTVTGNAILAAAGILGSCASPAKICLILRHLHRNGLGEMELGEAQRWEIAHAIVTVGVATAVAMTACTLFLLPSLLLQMLATGLIFGYCAGIASRIAVRPHLAAAALLIAAAPTIFAAGTWDDVAHRVIMGMFSVFLLGALQTTRFTYCSAVRNIEIRLDMATLARNDPLTGLSNRLGLREAFRKASHRGTIAIHYLDLDGFKGINDQFGHAAGDCALIEVAHRLAMLHPHSTFAARVGGDEFVLLQTGLSHENDARAFADRIRQAVSEPIWADGQYHQISTSVGYALSAAAVADLDNLLASADAEAYKEKRRLNKAESHSSQFSKKHSSNSPRQLKFG